MKTINKILKTYRKSRAVSPVIAAILLIGLAVLAGAAVFTIVLPLLSPSTSATNIEVDLSGNPAVSGATVTFSVSVANKGTSSVSFDVSSVTIGGNTTTLDSVKVGSTDASAGVDVPAGQSVTVVVTVTLGASFSAGTYNIVVTGALGDPINTSQDYTLSFTYSG